MNKIFKYIGCAALCSATLVACTPDEFDSPNGGARLKAADYAGNVEIRVDQQTNNAYFTFRPAAGVTPVWLIDGVQYNSDFTCKKYQRKAGKYDLGFMVKNANGLSVDTVWFDYTMNKTIMNGFAGFDVDYEHNLWKTATTNGYCNYYNPDPNWGNEIAEGFSVTKAKNDFILSLPYASYQQWQAQFFVDTDINTVETSTYDFSVILTSTTDHNSVTVKLVENGGNYMPFLKEQIKLKAGEPLCIYGSDLPGGTTTNGMQLVFDFGGNADNTEITIENIVFKDHQYDDGTVVPADDPEPVWVDVNSSDNLWKAATINHTFFYAYGDSWTVLPDPALSDVDGGYVLSLPTATNAAWQSQWVLHTDLAYADPTEEYDFCITLTSNNATPATVKLTQDDNDDNYFFASTIALEPDAEKKFWVSKVTAPNAMAAMKLVLDFGGNPANTEVTVKDIILQKHKE